ncbi:MAG: agmatinase [Candidatus Caldarchaeum sp.]|nr:agmatinase [Candidatus Caldarchaeum sp.]MDW7977986.1 agmatinase [Candidatus Caldarchaeum sp.]
MDMRDELDFLLRPRETFLGVEGDFSEARYLFYGFPYDLTSSFRPGSRYGPEAVRRFSANIEVNSYVKRFDAASAKLFDGGDIAFSYSLSTMLKRVFRLVRQSLKKGKTPVMVGGEHTGTLAAYLASSTKASAIVVFDAHFDLREEYGGLRVNHATYLRRLLERKPETKVVVVGVRGYDYEEERFAKDRNIIYIKATEVGDVSRTRRLLNESLKNRSVYVSVDVDVLDPSHAPGVGNPEPCGLSVDQVIELIHHVGMSSIVGFDVMEVNPVYDNGLTAAAASRILVELLASTAES